MVLSLGLFLAGGLCLFIMTWLNQKSDFPSSSAACEGNGTIPLPVSTHIDNIVFDHPILTLLTHNQLGDQQLYLIDSCKNTLIKTLTFSQSRSAK